MGIREMVRIDEEKCDGCGLCVPSCAEGAIQLIDGKARLISDNLCDGLGACLGDCPQGAITIEKREAAEFDEAAVAERLNEIGREAAAETASQASLPGGGCPSTRIQSSAGGCPSAQARSVDRAADPAGEAGGARPSALRQWPIQLHLVPPGAPFLHGADLLLAADCVPFAYADFHQEMLKNKALLIACPKLDDAQAYIDKLAQMFRSSGIKSVTVAIMEVPCCSGLVAIVKQALTQSGTEIPLVTVTVGINGQIK